MHIEERGWIWWNFNERTGNLRSCVNLGDIWGWNSLRAHSLMEGQRRGEEMGVTVKQGNCSFPA